MTKPVVVSQTLKPVGGDNTVREVYDCGLEVAVSEKY